ncbi:B-cell antigen receptor complex-associated protein alpha chain-like [Carcharodon carcharias]|uniref:B-cell antigen receptor complex-associated protein alpha chain-like n=1 Tax=Carcharodon carcharias TaxID=13397 RepID=UPI001B7E40A7|nr:B-cell antigen receptor complex-associated protein alpha chain-like [Carcharodon carcharias]
MANPVVQSLATWLLLMAMVADVGTLTIPKTSIRAQIGSPFQLQCELGPKESVTWERKAYNESNWQAVSNAGPTYTWQKVTKEHMGIYRCQNKHTREYSCDIGLRVYESPQKFFNIKESVKNIILMVEGVLLLGLVVIPGTILLREKSQKCLKEKIQRYKEENENLYEGLNQADQSTYEDITRGQQCMYQDVANYRLSDCHLEQP